MDTTARGKWFIHNQAISLLSFAASYLTNTHMLQNMLPSPISPSEYYLRAAVLVVNQPWIGHPLARHPPVSSFGLSTHRATNGLDFGACPPEVGSLPGRSLRGCTPAAVFPQTPSWPSTTTPEPQVNLAPAPAANPASSPVGQTEMDCMRTAPATGVAPLAVGCLRLWMR